MSLSIGISYPRSQIQVTQPQGEIRQRLTQARMEYRGPQLEIDQQQPMNEVGLGDLWHFTTKVAEEGRQMVLAGVAKRAQEGDAFARDMRSQDVSARLAVEAMRSEIPELNVDMVPKTRPTIRFDYQLEIGWQPGSLDINVKTYPPEIQWMMGSVHISMNKGSNLDTKG